MIETLAILWVQWITHHTSIAFKTVFCFLGAWGEKPFSFQPAPPRLAAQSRRIGGNCALFVLWTLGVSMYSVALVYFISQLSIAQYGLFRKAEWPFGVQQGLAFLILDATNYWIHRLEHSIPMVWRFHSVHHSDEYLDVSTTIRKHPICGFYTTSVVLVVVLAFGISPLSMLIYNVAADTVGFISHSSFAFPRRFSHWLQCLGIIAPEDHRIHHSDYQPETDSCFGQVFSFWDRLFGTYRQRESFDGLTFGLKEFSRPRFRLFPGVLWAPFVRPVTRSPAPH